MPGHQEIEIGLVKLYRLTGRKKYLDLAKFFLDERGDSEDRKLYGEYCQDHKPGRRTDRGCRPRRPGDLHVFRDGRRGRPHREMRPTSRPWTGSGMTWPIKRCMSPAGIGAAGDIEGFGPAYELPNDTAYCETCASIGYVLWNWRMFLLNGDSGISTSWSAPSTTASSAGSG